MTTSFDKTLKLAAKSIHFLPGCDRVTYIPRSGSSRQIYAVITRNQAKQPPGIDGGNLPAFEVLVENDSVRGIASDSIDTGGDKIELGKRVFNKPVIIRLTELLNHDAGMCLIAAS